MQRLGIALKTAVGLHELLQGALARVPEWRVAQVMREADSGRLSWGYHRVLLSGFVYLLSYVGDSKSYRVLINYVKSLDRPIPIGAMELISDLLPTFPELDIKELFAIVNLSDELKSAFGVMALTKLCFENRLQKMKRYL